MRKSLKSFGFYDIKINEYPYITKPLTSEQLRASSLLNFQQDGFNLTPLERLYHLRNEININENINKAAAAQRFIYDNIEMAPLYVDYSFIYTRYAYAGDAREQIRMYSRMRPEIKQLLNLKPRYGISFKISYMDKSKYGDILCINSCSSNFTEIYKEKNHWKSFIESTDLMLKINQNETKWQKNVTH